MVCKIKEDYIKKYIINNRIKAREVRLIDEAGNQVGVVETRVAQEKANAVQLDLVLISETANPPVCKIIDYGQFMYQQKKKEKQSRKSAQVTKELKMSPKISDHDYRVRLNRGIDFLKKKYKVKLTIFFRGREIVHQSLGETVLNRYIKEISEYGVADKNITRSGRQMIAIINPK